MDNKKLDRLLELTWNDLTEWAGTKIVSRAEGYKSKVSKVAVFQNGPIATVRGTFVYAVHVKLDENGSLYSECSCPYAVNCKHGVAAVLKYIEMRKEKIEVPEAKEQDPRVLLIKQQNSEPVLDIAQINSSIYGYQDEQNEAGQLAELLERKSKDELKTIIYELIEVFPGITKELIKRNKLTNVKAEKLIYWLKEYLKTAYKEIQFDYYGEPDENILDYQQINSNLKRLIRAGYADDVLEMADQIVSAGIYQIDNLYSEEFITLDFEKISPTLFCALEQSSATEIEKMEHALNFVLEDGYHLFDNFKNYLTKNRPESQWSRFADRLLVRLKEIGFPKASPNVCRDHFRDKFVDWLVYSLEKAGRKNEKLSICKAEARTNNNYPRLVEVLREQEKYDEAKKWIKEGVKQNQDRYSGIVSTLQEQLKQIYKLEKDWASAAIMDVENFVSSPNKDNYAACEKINKKNKTWTEVRELLLEYLEKGNLPWENLSWPLPKPKNIYAEEGSYRIFPNIRALVSIAIYEEDPKRVLYWFNKGNELNFRMPIHLADDAAEAAKDYSPQRAVSIWQKIAEDYIDETKVKSYYEAAEYLRKARKVMRLNGSKDEWEKYIKELQQKHRRKRRCIEILSKLSLKPIISD
ncbi:hypothetical protein L21SP3_01396 [Sedimentisphaera cyanobacteriorum]|uniref:SWIM-type domain-containing protein n=1 Tax=Sedimentisphaera cyanobacteriorum TaxID=1940790 RepID=A0A1Q2HQ49_9BACT|nr:SWIM zinc finger family protein [Sedimentisphaera cyanobacteriorum]AQQ09589.1 hypothetical protein L21SP3_01396 [Sedimentisphaera cyanobacteriorum]